MSCVADVKPTSQKMASVSWKKNGVGMVKAMPASAKAMIHCMVSVHQRLVRIISTNGLQKGLITQGRYSQPV